jgi:hypothetical protein
MSILWLPGRRHGETQLSQPTAKPLEKQMALADFAPVYRPVRSTVARVFFAVAKWVVTRRAEHLHRATMQRLLLEPEHRLRDLGISREALIGTPRISREDLIQAMAIHRK